MPTTPSLIQERRTEQFVKKFDMNGYEINASHQLITRIKNAKIIKPPSQDIKEMLDWLES